MAYTIGLDIGHGIDTFPPSKGIYKNGKPYAEHSFNAKLGTAIKKLLEHNGFNVVLGQQPNKTDVPLITRTNLYNSKRVDLVLSCHANYSGSAAANGRCAFYWHTANDSKRLATYIIDEIKKSGYSTHGDGLHASQPGSWTDLHICRETNMTAVLVEHGFMSNDDDFELIFGNKQKGYIEDMARADVKAICKFLGVKFKDTKNKGELTVSQYSKLDKRLKKLEAKLNGGSAKPTKVHKSAWGWLKRMKVTNGKDPRGYVTRQQLATMFRRYDKKRFPTGGKPKKVHKKFWDKLTKSGITNGKNPHEPMTREQFGTMLGRYEKRGNKLK